MVSYQGTCEFYDSTALFPRVPTKQMTYPVHSIMHYLEHQHPKFAWIAKMAKMDWYLANDTLRSTLFLPLESSLEDSVLLNLDINTARRIVKYHLMSGLFPIDVLRTSPFQELQSSIPSSTIICVLYDSNVVLNYMSPIVKSDLRMKNGLIHWIEKMLILS